MNKAGDRLGGHGRTVPRCSADTPVSRETDWRHPVRNRFGRTASACALAFACLAGTAGAQAPAPVSSVVEKPTYVTIPLEITVNRPAPDVWKRVGKWCDVSEWLQIPAGCKILSGTDGEVGSVRSVGNEILVGKSEFSYTYTQAVRADRVYNLYHGTLEVRPLTATTSKILYTLVFDNSMLPDDAAREKDKATRTAMFTRALGNMKTLAEGGTLPPPPARGAPPPAGAPTQR
jgi:hypothetical protein